MGNRDLIRDWVFFYYVSCLAEVSTNNMNKAMKEFQGLRSPVRCVPVVTRQRPGQRWLPVAPSSREPPGEACGTGTELPLCKVDATDDKSQM